jgi:hypothetical protein
MPLVFVTGVRVCRPWARLLDWPRTGDEDVNESLGALLPVRTGRHMGDADQIAREQPVRSSFSVKEEDSTCIQTDRNHGCGLAHVSTFSRNHVGGDGRTSAHDLGLLAAQQPPCLEQVPAGDIEDQTIGARQIGRRYLADGHFTEDKPDPMNSIWERFWMGTFSSSAYRPLTSPDLLNVRVASA